MIFHRGEQGSLVWAQARAGIPTASEFDQLLTTKFEPRKGQMPETYLAKKLAEWWLDGPLPGFNTLDMDFGQMRESDARHWYDLEYGVKIEQVGLITTDDNRVGCSPDGMLGPEGNYHTGMEIKSPAIHTHMSWLLDDVLPSEHVAQVHGGMYVTGLHEWVFLSYNPVLPPLVKRIPRDDTIQSRIAEALEMFLAKFEAGKKRLIEINGGPPKRATKPVAPAPESESESDPVKLKQHLMEVTRNIHNGDPQVLEMWLIAENIIDDAETIDTMTADRLSEVIEKVSPVIP